MNRSESVQHRFSDRTHVGWIKNYIKAPTSVQAASHFTSNPPPRQQVCDRKIVILNWGKIRQSCRKCMSPPPSVLLDLNSADWQTNSRFCGKGSLHLHCMHGQKFRPLSSPDRWDKLKAVIAEGRKCHVKSAEGRSSTPRPDTQSTHNMANSAMPPIPENKAAKMK